MERNRFMNKFKEDSSVAITNTKAVIRHNVQAVWDIVTSLDNYYFFTAKGDETELDFTEEVTAKPMIMKPFVKGFLKKQQGLYINDLKKELERQSKQGGMG